MSRDGLNHLPLCGSEPGEQLLKPTAVEHTETKRRNSKLKRSVFKRGGLQRSSDSRNLNQPEDQELFDFSADEKAVLEAKYKEKVAENEQLRATAYNLEYQLQDVHQDSKTKLSTSHHQTEEHQAMIDRLSIDIRQLQDQREAMQQKLSEDERLKESLRDLEKEEAALSEQIRSLADKCSYFQLQGQKQSDENRKLKTSKQDLQRRISEAELVISNQSEILIRQQMDVSSTEEMKEELRSQARKMQETIHELHQQAEQSNEKDALAVILKQGRTDELQNQPAKDPPEGALKNGLWNRCTRFLLAGVVAGLSTVGVLRSWDTMTLSVVTYYKNSAECLMDCVCQVLESQDGSTENNYHIF